MSGNYKSWIQLSHQVETLLVAQIHLAEGINELCQSNIDFAKSFYLLNCEFFLPNISKMSYA